MVIQGARQVGKSFIIRHVGKKLFENYIEINLLDDLNDRKIFQNIRNINDFYLQIGSIAGTKIGKKENTLIFLDEIQAYPHILTMLKFLVQDQPLHIHCQRFGAWRNIATHYINSHWKHTGSEYVSA